MPFSTDIVGTRSSPVQCHIDNRWAMNFAASVDDQSTVLFDTREGPIPVHPMFLAYPEWESQKKMRDRLGLQPNELSRAVQVSHDMRIFRALKAGMTLQTEATVIGIERHRAGAYSTIQHEHRTLDGVLVAQTTVSAIYRDVAVEGEDRPAETFKPSAADVRSGDNHTELLHLSSTACHVYSECARIWNPIHTDLEVAVAAGLPGLILHATGTIAKATSAITGRLYGGNPVNLIRIAGRFKAMVIVPTALKLDYVVRPPDPAGNRQVTFDLWTADGKPAISNGLLEYATTAVGG